MLLQGGGRRAIRAPQTCALTGHASVTQVGQAADERSKKDDDLWSPALRGGGHTLSRWHLQSLLSHGPVPLPTGTTFPSRAVLDWRCLQCIRAAGARARLRGGLPVALPTGAWQPPAAAAAVGGNRRGGVRAGVCDPARGPRGQPPPRVAGGIRVERAAAAGTPCGRGRVAAARAQPGCAVAGRAAARRARGLRGRALRGPGKLPGPPGPCEPAGGERACAHGLGHAAGRPGARPACTRLGRRAGGLACARGLQPYRERGCKPQVPGCGCASRCGGPAEADTEGKRTGGPCCGSPEGSLSGRGQPCRAVHSGAWRQGAPRACAWACHGGKRRRSRGCPSGSGRGSSCGGGVTAVAKAAALAAAGRASHMRRRGCSACSGTLARV